ncbi:MAG: Response regulator receiver domain protein (CheY-like) [Candidatus Uhrbacteria bacterium GW2011_GWF2_39_13]|uniref:Response regulator receiver domain protein (CheY-like) n=1 Tax=Candidatus Uhrbacteria bacterium GW2011_GWF2_39_13 TaxID=1618995 RepID=A0A0G0MXB2_9BACT|nr:MAG: Response regulator receiver domain protein (CheY-like) [Candidatus Uhrbacteria bacterium GW2011_GWF2_39_13]HAU66381.1 DNA-binding response regulator [Candidatus Uhrbacteria bacterium]
MKILVVEDEPKLNKGLVTGLQNRGYAVDFAFDGEEGEKMARVNDYDLLILDMMMPKRDGLEVCRSLRAFGVQTPILFLTARDSVEDKVMGLDLGADDYLVKPFSFEELVARIRTLLRRPTQTTTDLFMLDDLQLDTRSQTVKIKKKQLDLTLREYGILEYLLRNKGNLVTREDLLTHVWDRFFDSFSNVVDVHLKNLRKKLPSVYAKRIQTVWGKGYRLV